MHFKLQQHILHLKKRGFLFFWINSTSLLSLIRKWFRLVTSVWTWFMIIGRVSSIQMIQSFNPLACWDKRWATTLLFLLIWAGMHGCGSEPSAPAFDAAGRGDAGGTPQTTRPCRVVLHRATWLFPTRADTAEIGPTRSVSAVSACIGRVRPKFKKKKKKGAKRTVWLNLSTQTPSNPHISSKTPKGPLSLRPSSPFSVCCHCAPSLISILCVLSFLWVLCAHCTASAFRCALSLLFSWIFILCSLQFLSESENLYPWLLAVFFYLFFQLFLVGVKGFC